MSAAPKSSPTSKAKPWQAPAVCLVLALITFAVFGQTVRHEFITFDDDEYVYENPVVAQGLTRKGAAWAFSFHAYNWHPLTWLSHMLDCQIYGLRPGGHHLTNVLLHAATAIALFLVLRAMTGALWRSAFVAAVFAIHPLRAESVAWVAERKDVLGGLFFMLTLGAYVKYTRLPRSWRRYGLVMLLFALGLMCKPMLVTLPAVLLLLDYWPLQRMEAGKFPGLVMEKIPLLALSAAACVATLLAQNSALQSTTSFSLPLRFGNALVGVMIYLRQMVFPEGLALFYPYPFHGLPVWELALAGALLAGFSWLAFWQRKKQPWLPAGWLWFLVMLLPTLGIIQVGGQAHADRYTYLPQIGIYAALTWLAAGWLTNRQAAVLMVSIIAVLMGCAWKQTTYWRDSETLWTRSLASTTGNEVAHYGLGNALRLEGKLDAAILQYQDALQIKPDYADAQNNLGISLLDKGRVDDAIGHYRQALQIEPDYPQAHYNLASALLKMGRPDEAIPHFQQALKFRPDYAAAHYNLGMALLQLGHPDEAILHFQKALQLEPQAGEVYNNLGNALLQKGRLDEAIAQFQKALQINPSAASAELNLGIAFLQKGDLDEAVVCFKKSLQIKPAYAAAHYNLGNALFQKGKMAEAISHYQQALQLDANDLETQNNLAWILATCADATLRNGSKAVELARQANELSGGSNPLILHTFAAAFAETGQFADAIRTARKAIELAKPAGRQDLVNQLADELKLYEAGRPFRQ